MRLPPPSKPVSAPFIPRYEPLAATDLQLALNTCGEGRSGFSSPERLHLWVVDSRDALFDTVSMSPELSSPSEQFGLQRRIQSSSRESFPRCSSSRRVVWPPWAAWWSCRSRLPLWSALHPILLLPLRLPPLLMLRPPHTPPASGFLGQPLNSTTPSAAVTTTPSGKSIPSCPRMR